jgi:hypothetical protein
MIVSGVFLYARLNENSTVISMVLVLCTLGAGIGLFVPANEKTAFSTVTNQDYGMVSAMLMAFSTGSGALGTTIAVALAELARQNRIRDDVAGFVYDQQFAFSSLLPFAALAVLVTTVGKRR